MPLLSKIVISFETDLIADKVLSFNAYNKNTDASNIIEETWKATRSASYEVEVGTTTGVPGEISAINYITSFNLDYNTNDDYVLTRFRSEVTIEAKSSSIIFKDLTTTTPGEVLVEYINNSDNNYYFEYKDVKNILHRVEIKKEGSDLEPIEIKGSVFLDGSESEDTLELIRGTGLKIDLEANDDLTFQDLYSEDERTFSVSYQRSGITLFNGWLSPEGLYQSFVSDKWIISLDATDGLGFLKNLSYVDSEGIPYTGKQSLMEIVVNCLKRTGIEQNINTSIKIHYKDLLSSTDIFRKVHYNSDRFIKDDGDTIMNCEEVLQSVLEPFGACLSQKNGEWIIYKPNTLYQNAIQPFFRADFEGTLLTPNKKDINFSQVLGSQINNRYPHHVNANQQISTSSSIGAFRINYKYGLVNSLFTNPFLENIGGVVADWTITDDTQVSFPANNLGLILSEATSEEVMESDVVTLSAGESFDIRTSFTLSGFASYHDFKVILTGATETYYLINNGTWTTSPALITYFGGAPNPAYPSDTSEPEFIGDEIKTTLEIKSNILPVSGTVQIHLITPSTSGSLGGDIQGSVFIEEFSITPTQSEDNKEGENHTFQRKDRPSSKIADIKEVFNGDNPSDIYVGTIYKEDETTATSVWSRDGYTEEKPLLQIMGEERMRMYAKPLKLFSGDVFGFIDHISVVEIDGVLGKFMPISYSYDTLNNITVLKLKEILNNELTDVSYKVTFDYGNVVEPTIQG